MGTLLKVVSILYIISACFSLIMGVLAFAGGGMLSSLGLGVAGAASAMVVAVGLGIIAFVSGVFGLIVGILGLKGSNGDYGKLKVAWVLSIIVLALNVMSLISCMMQGVGVFSGIVGLILPILFLISATSVKNEMEA